MRAVKAVNLIDPTRAVDLTPYGLPGFQAAVAVQRPTGRESLWLVEVATLGTDHGELPVPEHERTGLLPTYLRDWFGLEPRCGRPTKSGEPCRVQVREHGQHCRLRHREAR